MEHKPHKDGHPYFGIGLTRPRLYSQDEMKKTPMQDFIKVLKIHRDTAYEKAGNSRKSTFIEYYDSRAKAFEDAISFAEAQIEKEAMTHDKILSMTDDFIQSNRKDGEIYSHYHYDMMADFALYILETFKTKER